MRRALIGALVALAVWPACKAESPRSAPLPATSTTASLRPVRVGVWMPPDPADDSYGGAAVRTLVHPQLFRATPQGKWEASLAQPGSDRTSADAMSARFRIRRNARWSDGAPITVEDLRRTRDARFVTAVDDPAADGTIVVHFSQPLPGWRRLWSGLATIAPPRDNVFGGPYRVERVTPGLETVLVVNDEYFGASPRVRHLHLVLVPQAEIQVRLMEQGDLDVIAPLAFTDRRARLGRIASAGVLVGTGGGWTASLVANPARLDPAQRHALFALANPPRFADVLLRGEATATGERPAAPSPQPAGATPALVAPRESAPAALLVHGMQRAAFKAGRSFELRQTDFDRVFDAYAAASYDVLFAFEPSAVERCWTCSYATIDSALARDADARIRGAAEQLLGRAAADHLVLPLWRERPVAAVRDGLEGVSVNGFHVAGPLWNVEKWHWGR